MSSTPDGVAFTLPQLASFLAWSEEEATRHGLRAMVRWDYGLFEEVIEVHSRGETPLRPRWLVHRAPDGAICVTWNGVGRREMLVASAAEAQVVIEMDAASERRINAKRAS